MDTGRVYPLGLLGKYYAARHSLGQYRSDAVTATYSYSLDGLQSPDTWLKEALEHALAAAVMRHPALCYAILEQPQSDAKFLRLLEILWEDVVEFNDFSRAGAFQNRDENSQLAEALGVAHEKYLTHDPCKPAWRLLVFQYPCSQGARSRRVDITFIAHHTIADGLSCAAFHRSLLEGFYSFDPQKPSSSLWPVAVPSDTQPPDALESRLDISQAEPKEYPKNSVSQVWTAKDIQPSAEHEFRSFVRIINISQSSLSQALKVCKNLNITLTGYIHGLIISFLSRNVPEALEFRSVTPYSLRAFTGAPADEMINHVSWIISSYLAPQVSAFRNVQEGSADELAIIRNIGIQFREEMATELAQCPKNIAWAAVAGIENFYEHCRGEESGKRGCTYEFSNLGSVKVPQDKDGKTPLSLESLALTQSAMVIGPAMGFNGASVAGKGMTLTLAWQKDIVEDGLMENLASTLKARLDGKTEVEDDSTP